MLHACAHAAALDAAHHGRPENARQIRVFAEILEITPAQGASLHIDARAQHHIDLLVARLLADGRAHLFDQRFVERARQSARRGKAGGRLASMDAQMVGAVFLLSQSVGPVGKHHGRDAVLMKRTRFPMGDARKKRGLLGSRQRRRNGTDIHADPVLRAFRPPPRRRTRSVRSKTALAAL